MAVMQLEKLGFYVLHYFENKKRASQNKKCDRFIKKNNLIQFFVESTVEVVKQS